MKEKKAIFWDFDGVIKESVDVKTEAYIRFFDEYGPEISAKVRMHHEANGGLSRFEKIPIYLDWAGVNVTETLLERCCMDFAEMVVEKVIDSKWVKGAREYLEKNNSRQRFVIVTGTPQKEMELILWRIGIDKWFDLVYGAPFPKHDAVRSVIDSWGLMPKDCLLIGDSGSDLKAAVDNDIEFLLRLTKVNHNIQAQHSGRVIKDFSNE